MIDSLTRFNVLETVIKGEVVAENGKSFIPSVATETINTFNANPTNTTDFEIPFHGQNSIPVIGALDGQLITENLQMTPKVEDNKIVQDTQRDLLKISVINRYNHAPIASAFIAGFGIKDGAIASTVAHDSHNIVVVGSSDEWMCKAANAVIEKKGGISAVNENETKLLALPIAGLMSDGDGYEIAQAYSEMDQFAKATLGSVLHAPFMTLSFMALLVIPQLKLSDKGLFDGKEFRLISI
jgi:adenine deaminase